MKRSEMLDTIAFELERLGANDEIVDIWATSILLKMEVNGMMPPCDNRGLRINKEAINYCKWEEE